MAVERRYVHQWQQIGGLPCDGKTKHWTEVSFTVDDLAEMVGCASGSVLISLHIDRDGSRMTLTFDERQEPGCSDKPYESYSSASPGPSPGSPYPSSPSA